MCARDTMTFFLFEYKNDALLLAAEKVVSVAPVLVLPVDPVLYARNTRPSRETIENLRYLLVLLVQTLISSTRS
jgi:hypothetical protein